MKGDFSRITFDPANHFSRVLNQQGRVTLDADFNEQADILLHLMRTLARDLFGRYGGPVDGGGFGLIFNPPYDPKNPKNNLNLYVDGGHYYVDGILCESEGCYYGSQPDALPVPNADPLASDPALEWLKNPNQNTAVWIYLDVWERHITRIEKDAIREVALGTGNVDSCTRAKVVWQIRALTWSTDWKIKPTDPAACAYPLDQLPSSTARMAAQLATGVQIKDACSIAPDAKYRGAENQLYRVEVHRGSAAGESGSPTFKWSRDNGSVATSWLGTEGNDLIVASARGFAAGCWVELSHDALDLNGQPGTLVKLAQVAGDRLSVDSGSGPGPVPWTAQLVNPKIRRWDQSENDDIVLDEGAVPIIESADSTDPTWIDLEDGIQVWFESGGIYHSGDYWLIPARVATGGIEWSSDAENSLLKPPRGIRHHYAPLGILNWDAKNNVPVISSCRSCNQTSPAVCAPPSPPPKVLLHAGPLKPASMAGRTTAAAKPKSAGDTGRSAKGRSHVRGRKP